MSETTPEQFRQFIQDLLDDLAATIDDPGTTQEQWLRFAAHWGDQAGDL